MKAVNHSITPLPRNGASRREAGQLLNLAFAEDPLIRWLRPASLPDDTNSTALTKWQTRRLQRFQLYGTVLALRVHGHRSSGQKNPSAAFEPLLSNTRESDSSLAALAMFETVPKASFWQLGIECWLQWIAYNLAELFSPATDDAADLQRIGAMIQSHEENMALATSLGNTGDMCYLEVVAVHPDMQGQRLGQAMMEEVLEEAGTRTIVLDCTMQSNVRFYQSFGFEVLKECTLSAPDRAAADQVTTWFMIRHGVS